MGEKQVEIENENERKCGRERKSEKMTDGECRGESGERGERKGGIETDSDSYLLIDIRLKQTYIIMLCLNLDRHVHVHTYGLQV